MVSRILLPAGPQRLENFLRKASFCRGQVLEFALAIYDLLQPESRSHVVLRQTPATYEKSSAKRVRAKLRTQTRRLGHVHEPECNVLGPDASRRTTPPTTHSTGHHKNNALLRDPVERRERLREVRPVAHEGPLHPDLEPPQRQLPRGRELDEV